ncbi:MAG: MmcQ/YjbR family DNA-binding protein [Clostridiales bacterium]|nr:MmcQ/YjbR family DNA-binding protein [Clostridiales bacterium]
MKKFLDQEAIKYVQNQYGTEPDHPFEKDTVTTVFRHADNKKWFGLIMYVSGVKLGLGTTSSIPVINLKIDDPVFRDILIEQPGIIPAYHMNKRQWITVFLDGTVQKERVFDLIDASFSATASKQKNKKDRAPKEWIIPSNPKYYDVIQAFEEAEEIDWKQGAGIKTGDTIYLYVGSPISAILYKCRVTETDIPYHYQDENLTIKALMKIKLLKRYDKDSFTFKVLNDEYGIFAVRGPRGVPFSLSEALNNE